MSKNVKKKKLKIVTFNISQIQLDMLDKLVNLGHSPNRSELLRRIFDSYLVDYYKTVRTFEVLTPEQIKIIGI